MPRVESGSCVAGDGDDGVVVRHGRRLRTLSRGYGQTRSPWLSSGEKSGSGISVTLSGTFRSKLVCRLRRPPPWQRARRRRRDRRSCGPGPSAPAARAAPGNGRCVPSGRPDPGFILEIQHDALAEAPRNQRGHVRAGVGRDAIAPWIGIAQQQRPQRRLLALRQARWPPGFGRSSRPANPSAL
jgi:hypothetical protein